MNEFIKLSAFAKRMGVAPRTAYHWYQKGLIPGATKTPTGRIVVPKRAISDIARKGRVKVKEVKEDG